MKFVISSEQKGIILVLCYISIAGTANIFLANYLKKYDQFLITAICFTCANIYFFIINLNALNKVYIVCKTYYKDFITLNIYTTANWLAFYFSLSVLDPIVSITIIHIVGVICSNLSSKYFKNYTYLYIIAILLLFIHSIGQQAHNIFSISTVIFALILAHISGVCVFKTTELSKRFHTIGLSTNQVLLIRFYTLIIICLIKVSCSKTFYFNLQFYDIFIIILIGFLSIIMPVYLLQKAYTMAKIDNIMLTLSFAPVFVLFLQFLDTSIDFSILVAFSVLIASIASVKIVNFKNFDKPK